MGRRGPARKGEGVRSVGDAGLRAPQGATARVKAQYRRLAAVLPEVTAADAALIETLAQSLLLQRDAFALLEAHGLLVVDAAHGGDVRRNPALIAWRTAAEVTRAAAMRLGASPLDRQRMPEVERDPREHLMALLNSEEAGA